MDKFNENEKESREQKSIEDYEEESTLEENSEEEEMNKASEAEDESEEYFSEYSGTEADGSNHKSLLETIYGVFFEPKLTFNHLGKKKPILWALLVFTGIFLFNYFMSIAGYSVTPPDAGWDRLTGNFAVFICFIGLIIAFAAWFLNAAIINLIAQFLGGNGNGVGLFAAMAFTDLPLIIAAILNFFIGIIGLPPVLAVFVQVVVIIWVLILQVIAVSEIQELTIAKSILVYLVPVAFILILVLILGSMLMTMFAPLLKNFAL